ncbi:MAG: hypothetical protein ACLFTW_15180, partial [Chitinispirillaceae bacterium]
ITFLSMMMLIHGSLRRFSWKLRIYTVDRERIRRAISAGSAPLCMLYPVYSPCLFCCVFLLLYFVRLVFTFLSERERLS